MVRGICGVWCCDCLVVGVVVVGRGGVGDDEVGLLVGDGLVGVGVLPVLF